MPGRNLTIDIDGEPTGFDRACDEAAVAARKYDRELEKTERAQKAQERAARLAAVAIKEFGSESNKAALAARRMGDEAQRAGEQAVRAETRAAAAAKAAEKGLISEERAAKLAADADDKVARAALKAAEAYRAQARAADEAADQERQLARDAELAAAAERLAALKSAGAIKTHNAILRQLEQRFGDLSKEGSGAFKQIEESGSSFSKMLMSVGSSGPGAIALVVAALAAVPFVATAAEAAVGLGLGGALAGLGLKAAAGDKRVQAALHSLAAHVKAETKQISAPFVQTWLDIARTGRETFDELAPHIKRDFAELAPAVSGFVADAGVAAGKLAPAFDASADAADKLLGALGDRLPDIAGNLSRAIQILADGAGEDADEFANLLENASALLPVLANTINVAQDLASTYSFVFSAFSHGVLSVNAFRDGLSRLTGGLISTDHSLQTGGGEFKSFGDQAATGSVKLSALDKDMRTLASTTASATQKANALSDAFNRLLNPAEAVFTDTAKLKDGIGELSKALETSHGRLNDNTAASRAAKQAFTGVIDNAKALASDLLNSGKSIDVVRARLNPYIHSLYEAAGSNKQARALVDAFVQSLGEVPPTKGTTLTLNDREFLSKLHDAQGLKLDPKTGYLLGNNANYFNSWLKANGLRLDPKTGLFRGNNADYYNKWLAANHLKIDTKTGRITGNTSAFWAAVHAIPQTVGYRKIGVYYVPLNSANEPGHTRHNADGAIDRYANGGVRRDLDPMVVTRPTVLFGETQTGGEAYIPLGLNKRGRSTELLRQVAREFGLDVVKRTPVPAAAPVLSGASGGSARPPITQNNYFQSEDPHEVAQTSARELAWIVR